MRDPTTKTKNPMGKCPSLVIFSTIDEIFIESPAYTDHS
jgi:hypothetical protein